MKKTEHPDLNVDVWAYREENRIDSWVVVPICQTLDTHQHLVMGAGLAKQAAIRNPKLPECWGRELKAGGEEAMLLFDRHDHLIGLPTKQHWREPSSVRLIRRGLQHLRCFSLDTRNAHFLIPRLGCGLGGLDWDKIKPIILAELAGHSFTLVYQ